jgi:ATP-dependent Lhr-like helicase
VLTETLLERHGVLTRGAVFGEHVTGGFAAVYQVLRGLEDTGRVRRGYIVEGLGAAQFSLPGAVDRLRALSTGRAVEAPALVLATTDPANPYGAALPWPQRSSGDTHGHRPGRKAGAVVALVDGRPVLYLERGGASLLSWDDSPAALDSAAAALARAVRDGALGRLTVERADGAPVSGSPVATARAAAGFVATPRGLRLRG